MNILKKKERDWKMKKVKVKKSVKAPTEKELIKMVKDVSKMLNDLKFQHCFFIEKKDEIEVFASCKPMFLVKVNERSNNIVDNLADHLCEKLIKMFKDTKKNTTQPSK